MIGVTRAVKNTKRTRTTAAVLILLNLLALTALAVDTTIHLGRTEIAVPAPTGFVPVTKEMTAVDSLMDTFVGPDNVRFVNFLPQDLAPAALKGEVPNLVRYLSLQSYKKTVTQIVTTADFIELKSAMQKQYGDMLHKLEKQMPDLMEKINKRLEGQLNAPLNLNVNEAVPLPAHDESERSLAVSVMMNLAVKLPDGETTNAPVVMTTTLVHVRGKVLFAYVYGEGKDLEWTRKVSKEWSDAILAANPSDAATAAKEAPPKPMFSTSAVVRGAIIGAAIGALIGLVRSVTRRKTSTPPPPG